MVTISAILKETVSGKLVAGKVITFAVTGAVADNFSATTDASGACSVQKDYAPGNYSISASVTADSTYNAATSTVVPFTVGKLNLTLTLTVS